MARGKAKTKKIAARGKARAEKRAARKEQRTERLAGRKNITTDQAKRLQANRRQRFKEFASGGTENITTGRLRFKEGDGGIAGSEATGGGTADNSSTAVNARANAAFAANKPKIDQQGIFGTNLTASDFRTTPLGSTDMLAKNRAKTAAVDVGEHELGSDSGYSKKARGAAGYS